MVLSFKAGIFSARSTTGTQSVTGVGFQPKALILHTTAGILDTFEADTAWYTGFASSSTLADQKSLAILGFDAQDPSDADSGWDNAAIFNHPDVTVPAFIMVAELQSFDSDGFTLDWTITEFSAFEIGYIAIGGADVTNADVGQFNAPAVTGNNAVTGVGFQPDLIFLMGTNHTADNNQLDTQGNWSFGVAKSTTQRALCAGMMENGVGTMDTARYQRTDKCLAMFSNTDSTVLTHEADLVSMDSDGFTLNYTTASSSNKRVAYLALKGGNYAVGSFTSPTAGTAPVAQSVTGVGFQPDGVMFMTNGATASSSIQTHMRNSLGAANSSSSEWEEWCGDEDAATAQITATMADTDAVIRVSDEAAAVGSSTTQALADFTSLDADGFSVSWSVRDSGNAYEVIYVAFGDTPAAPAAAAGGEVSRTATDMLMTGLAEIMTSRRKRGVDTRMGM